MELVAPHENLLRLDILGEGAADRATVLARNAVRSGGTKQRLDLAGGVNGEGKFSNYRVDGACDTSDS
jgi:hypothetical protein